MAAKTTKKAPQRAASKAKTRVRRVSAKQRGTTDSAPKQRAVKRTIKKKRAPAGPSARIKPAKPSAEHPLPEPIATFTF